MNTAFRRDMLLLPNLISLGRIVLIMIAAALIFTGYPLLGLIIGVIGGLSDYFDGYLARKRNETTELGALLDLLADILFTLVCLTIGQLFGVWPAYLILVWGFRDMTVISMRASAGQQGFTIKSSFLGKVGWNFNAYGFVLMGLDIARPFPSPTMTSVIHWMGLFAIHAGLLMQWISGARYLAQYAAKYRGR